MKSGYIFFLTAWMVGLLALQFYPALSESDAQVPDAVIAMLRTKMYVQGALLVFPIIVIWHLGRMVLRAWSSDSWPPEGYLLPKYVQSMKLKRALTVALGVLVLTAFYILLQCLQLQNYVDFIETVVESFPSHLE